MEKNSDQFDELQSLIVYLGNEILINQNKILIQLNLMQNNKSADKEEIRKSAEKKAQSVIEGIFEKINASNGMTRDEYINLTGNTPEEDDQNRIDFENAKLTDIDESILFGDD